MILRSWSATFLLFWLVMDGLWLRDFICVIVFLKVDGDIVRELCRF